MSDAGRYQPKERVLCQVVDGESVLLDVDLGQYFGLNAVGTTVWNGIGDGLGLDEIQAAVVQEFEVSPEQAAEDVQEFIAQLQSAGLVKSIATASK